MAKLYFHYSTMNAGKSTLLLQASYNYRERGMRTLLLTARLDDRAAEGVIASRIGISDSALTFAAETDLFDLIRREGVGAACIFVDEAQFLSADQVWQLARVADDLGQPVMCYGLRVDFRGEVRTICHCGRKATMVVRRDDQGRVITDGAQVVVGGNERYVSLCRRHWREATEHSTR